MDIETGVEYVLSEAVQAFRRGTRGMGLHPAAIDAFRRQFASRVYVAVALPDWRERWRDERVYVRFITTEMGRCAARLAKDDLRAFIDGSDVDTAVWKLRGHLPIAGRWCPV